jgi:hypothetical protein
VISPGLLAVCSDTAECIACHEQAERLVELKLRNRRAVRSGFIPSEEPRTELNSVVSRMQTFERSAVDVVSALSFWIGEP